MAPRAGLFLLSLASACALPKAEKSANEDAGTSGGSSASGGTSASGGAGAGGTSASGGAAGSGAASGTGGEGGSGGAGGGVACGNVDAGSACRSCYQAMYFCCPNPCENDALAYQALIDCACKPGGPCQGQCSAAECAKPCNIAGGSACDDCIYTKCYAEALQCECMGPTNDPGC